MGRWHGKATYNSTVAERFELTTRSIIPQAYNACTRKSPVSGTFIFFSHCFRLQLSQRLKSHFQHKTSFVMGKKDPKINILWNEWPFVIYARFYRIRGVLYKDDVIIISKHVSRYQTLILKIYS